MMLTVKLNQDTGLKVHLRPINSDCAMVKFASEVSDFSAKKGELFFWPKENSESVLLAGLGELSELKLDDLRTLAFKIVKELVSHKVKEASVKLPELELDAEQALAAFFEGLIHSDYKFNKGTKDKKEQEITINVETEVADAEKVLEEVQNVMEGVFLARDLTNLTSNEMHPADLANCAKEKLEPLGVKVTILNEEEMLEKGMEAAYSVGKGSSFRPQFVVLEYNGDDSTKERTALVGKAICYDSGGYSLKPTSGMITMQADMGGAASVIGAFLALAKNKVKANVIGTFAPVENLVSGTSYRVGDIIGSMSGQTIEVENTDAEGRVTLADAIYYATSQDNVTRVIDIATLTGACVSALGTEFTGAITNNQEFYDEFIEAADLAGEKVWQLPISDDFKKANKSKVADFTNSAGFGGGTITAGLFVGEFLADKDLPWIHLDVAGTAYLGKPCGYLPERATGVHVKAFYNLLAK